MKAIWTTAICLAFLASSTGCDGKIAQCNRLIDVINKEQKPLKSKTGNDPKHLKELATTLASVSKKVRAVQLKDAKLKSFRDEYAKMAEDLASAAKATATAFESNDPKKAAAAASKMTKFGPRESKLVDNINNYCQGK